MKLLLDVQNTTESPKFNPHKTKTKNAYSSELRRPKHQPYKKEKYKVWWWITYYVDYYLNPLK